MEFKKIDAKEYQSLVTKYGNYSFTHLLEWGKFRSEALDWNFECLGAYQNQELIGCGLIQYKKAKLTKFKIAYCSGGYILKNINDQEDFDNGLTKYLKSQSCFLLKIDPYNGSLMTSGENQEITSLVKRYSQLGYKHLGFYNQFEGMQPRHTIRIDTSQEKLAVLKAMTKHTQRNIKTAHKFKCLEVVECDSNSLHDFHDLLVETSLRDKFGVRDYSYFETMLQTVGSKLRITLAKVDLKALLAELEANASNLQKQLKKAKSENQLKSIEQQFKANQERLDEVTELCNQGKESIYLAANLSIKSENRCWYLYGASSNSLRFMRAVYLLMDDMVDYCQDNHIEYYDLYGVSGVFDKDHPDYGLFQFKSGFNGQVIEFPGEFDKPLIYPLYLAFNKLYPKLKKVRKRSVRRG